MIEINDELKNKIKTSIEELGFFLYYIDQEKIGSQSHVIIYVNKDNYDSSISLDDCVLVTRKINEFIDDYLDCEYVLEISSSGVNRRLYEPRHYQEICGQKIKVQLKNKVEGLEEKKIENILEAVNEDGIVIQNTEIDFKNIKKAYYVGGKND